MITDKKILSYTRLGKKIARIRKGKKVVVVTGSFDLVHAGHLMFLDFAKRQGDILVVGVGADKSIKKLKGGGRPIIPELPRARMIAGLEAVDFVVLLKEPIQVNIDSKKLFETIKPDIWVLPYEDSNLAGKRVLARQMGIEIKLNPRIKPNRVKFPISTSYIVEKIGQLNGK